MSAPTWACEAYGPEGLAFGAWCFLSAESGARTCPGPAACATAMRGERQRLFQRINELAAAGDEVSVTLADEFTNPDELLGGPGETPDERPT